MIPDCMNCGNAPSHCACFDCNCETCVEMSCRCRQYDRESREEPEPMPPPRQLTEEQLDELVSSTSVPNLGALIRQGKKQGLIKAAPAY